MEYLPTTALISDERDSAGAELLGLPCWLQNLRTTPSYWGWVGNVTSRRSRMVLGDSRDFGDGAGRVHT